jgi:hypothetical protein
MKREWISILFLLALVAVSSLAKAEVQRPLATMGIVRAG